MAQIDGDGDPVNPLLTGFEYNGAGRLWRTIEHLDGTSDPADRYVVGTGDRVAETRYTPGGRTAAQVGPPPNAVTFDWGRPGRQVDHQLGLRHRRHSLDEDANPIEGPVHAAGLPHCARCVVDPRSPRERHLDSSPIEWEQHYHQQASSITRPPDG